MAHFLAIDIGNTRIHLGLVRDGAVTDAADAPTAEAAMLERNAPDFLRRARSAAPRAAAFVSARPSADNLVRGVLRRVLGIDALKLGADRPVPVENRTDHPVQVGTDRLVNALAARARARGACVVASLGTAVTVDAVAADGAFLGGAILPGLRTQARALHDYCAQLPAVEVGAADGEVPEAARPRRAIGRSTVEAIRGGIALGLAGAVRRLVDDARRELAGVGGPSGADSRTECAPTRVGAAIPLLLTGGDAELVALLLGEGDVVPHLTLEGVARACENG